MGAVQLAEGLKKHNWQNIVSEVTANNSTFLNNVSYWQRINRIIILDKTGHRGPDGFQRIPGYDSEVPVFLYTGPDAVREVNKQELQREMFVHQMFCEDNIYSVRNTLKTSPAWGYLHENDTFVQSVQPLDGCKYIGHVDL